MKRNVCFLIFGLFCCCVKTSSTQPQSEILWDNWGIPHIHAQSEYELYKMAGWAQMSNHANLLLKLYGEARGRSAEYWGTGLKRDRLLHQLGLVENSGKAYARMTSLEREMFVAFADGINAYAEKHPQQIADSLYCVLPVEPKDVLSHAFRIFYLEFLINRALKKEKQFKAGSNAWAISGEHTQSGSPLLLANPHLPWYDFWMFFECHYISNQLNLYGVTLIGLPTIGIGFNDVLGWTHTVNVLDNVDLYKLEKRGESYRLSDRYVPFEVDTIYLKVREGDRLRQEPLLRKRSAHGVVMEEGENNAIALRYANMDQPFNVLKQWKAMGEARSLEEFEAAIKLNTLPLYNILYSDVDGNILYHMGGQVPRKNGDWGKWQSAVDGSVAADIWTEYYDYEQLPHLLNPPTGWLQNCNDPPFTNTFPNLLTPSAYPSHMVPNRMSFRAQRSVQILQQLSSPVSLEQMVEWKHDTRSSLAERWRDDLQALKQHSQDSLSLAAIDALLEWDGTFESSSKGAVLFHRFVQQLRSEGMNSVFASDWNFARPLQTPDGFADPARILTALQQAAQQQLKAVGQLTVPYGEQFRVKVGKHDYPANGGFGHMGIFRTMSFKPAADQKFYAYHGDGFVCAMSFESQVKAKALLSYGNATQPGHPHVGDQLALFSDKKLREVWFVTEDQLQHVERREQLEEM
ncbi:MAG: penicillin acylase family protein [Bacteroidota bacterium]